MILIYIGFLLSSIVIIFSLFCKFRKYNQKCIKQLRIWGLISILLFIGGIILFIINGLYLKLN